MKPGITNLGLDFNFGFLSTSLGRPVIRSAVFLALPLPPHALLASSCPIVFAFTDALQWSALDLFYSCPVRMTNSCMGMGVRTLKAAISAFKSKLVLLFFFQRQIHISMNISRGEVSEIHWHSDDEEIDRRLCQIMDCGQGLLNAWLISNMPALLSVTQNDGSLLSTCDLVCFCIFKNKVSQQLFCRVNSALTLTHARAHPQALSVPLAVLVLHFVRLSKKKSNRPP